MRNIAGTIILICILLSGCSQGQLHPADYVKWVENEDNGLRKSKTMGDYTLTLQYKPIDYVVLLEEKTEDISSGVLKDRARQLDQMQYYNFRLQSGIPGANVSDIAMIDNDHATVVNYLTFGIQENIYLVDGNDTLSCKLFQYERTYDLAPYIDFVLAFDLPSNPTQVSDKIFVLEDTQLGIGIVRFQIDKGSLSAIPQLITN